MTDAIRTDTNLVGNNCVVPMSCDHGKVTAQVVVPSQGSERIRLVHVMVRSVCRLHT